MGMILYSLALLALFGLGIFVLSLLKSIGDSATSGLTQVLIAITPDSRPKTNQDFDKFMSQEDKKFYEFVKQLESK
jgi:hypothetical protein